MEEREVRQTKKFKEIQPKRYLHQCHPHYCYRPSTINLYYYCSYHYRHCLLSNYCVLGTVTVLYVHNLFLKTTRHSPFHRRGNWHREQLTQLFEATELVCLISGYTLYTSLSFSWLGGSSVLPLPVNYSSWMALWRSDWNTAWLFKLTFSHIGRLMIL